MDSDPGGTNASSTRSPDLLVWGSAGVALVVYVLHGFHGPLTRDLGVYTYGAQRLLEGDLPYVAILNRAGPLAHVLPAFGIAPARLLGVDDVVGARVFFMLIAVAGVATAYAAGRSVLGSRVAGLVSAATMLSFHGFIVHATDGPREKTALVLLVLLVAWAMQARRWYAVGFLTALATLTWQPVFLPLLLGTVATVLLDAGATHRLRVLLRVAVGGLVPTLMTVLVYTAAGRLELFVDCFVRLNVEYTRRRSPLGHLDQFAATMAYGYGWSLVGLVVGLAVLLVAGALACRARSRRTPEGPVVAGLAVGAAVSIGWTSYAYDSWPDASLLLPYAALGTGGAYALAARWIGRGRGHRPVVAVGLAWCLLAVGGAAAYSVTHRSDVLDLQRGSTEAVMGALPPSLPGDAVLLSLDAPSAVVLARRRNPMHLQLFGKGLTRYVRQELPGGVRGYVRRIEQLRPAVIAVGTTAPDWLRPALRGHQRVGGAPGWSWYVRRDLGPDTIDAMRADLHRARTERDR